MPSTTAFSDSYGPWALIAGASEGVGSALAEELATRGLNVALIARRAEVLDQVAAGIAERTGVLTRTLAVDLERPDATTTIAAAMADVEVGFLAYCAGADPVCKGFLSQTMESAEAMVHRNCVVPLQLIHHFGAAMIARGTGGIVTFSSGAGFVGGGGMATYGGSKAFDLVFTEALWAELKPQGVDVLAVVLGETDTPALRRMQNGDAEQPVKKATPVSQVVTEILTHLDRGPTRMVGSQVKFGSKILGLLPRRTGVQMITKAAARATNQDAR